MGVLDLETLQFMAVSVLVLETVRSVETESMPLSSRVCGGRIYATILPCMWRQNLCHYPPVSVEAESMPLSSRVCGGRIYATILPCLWRQNLCHYPPMSVEAESMPLSSRVCGGRIFATILPCSWFSAGLENTRDNCIQSDLVNPCFFNPYASQSEHNSW